MRTSSLQRPVSALSLFFILALPASTNYELKSLGIGSGGAGNASSNTVSGNIITGELGATQLDGTTYDLGPGLTFTQQSNVPGQPTFDNPSNYYNKLRIIIATGSNPTDTLFAIAISTDNFTTTNYVQSDNTVGASLGTEDYQTYTNWGGASGEFVVGLTPGVTYKIKVKAMHGLFTESAYSQEASAATVDTNITFAISGIVSGTNLEGVTTDITTTATNASFGELPFDQSQEAASRLTVTTNATNGYTVTVAQTGALQTAEATTFPQVSGTNASPSTWPASVLTGAYGYHTSDAVLGTGTTTRFVADDTFAQFETTAQEVAYNAAAVSSEATDIVYSIEAGRGQEAGNYTHSLTFIATGVY